jgi:hypothetical protein
VVVVVVEPEHRGIIVPGHLDKLEAVRANLAALPDQLYGAVAAEQEELIV